LCNKQAAFVSALQNNIDASLCHNKKIKHGMKKSVPRCLRSEGKRLAITLTYLFSPAWARRRKSAAEVDRKLPPWRWGRLLMAAFLIEAAGAMQGSAAFNPSIFLDKHRRNQIAFGMQMSNGRHLNFDFLPTTRAAHTLS
jgi:hypothetical protein